MLWNVKQKENTMKVARFALAALLLLTAGAAASAQEPTDKARKDFQTGVELYEEGNYEVVLSLTLTAKIDDETAFLVEVQQAGVFFIQGFTNDQLRRVLGTAAPNILFPYARENIDSLVVKGGFPPVMLAPVNFDALFEQALQQQAQQQAQQDGQNGQGAQPGADAATH